MYFQKISKYFPSSPPLPEEIEISRDIEGGREVWWTKKFKEIYEAYLGRFPITKEFGNFLLGISVREGRIPFVTGSNRGSRGRLSCVVDRERYGTGDKNDTSVNWNTNFHWEASIGKT